MIKMKKLKTNLKVTVFAVIMAAFSANLHSATIGFGNAFGNFLSSSGSALTEGGVSVGFFTVALPTSTAIASISNLNYTSFSSTFGFVDVRTMRDSNNNLPTWVSGGWDFASGFTGGTLTVPATPNNPPTAAYNHSDSLTTFASGATTGTALWVVAFNKGNYANNFAGATEWALVTATAPAGTANDWIYPTSSENIQLSQINATSEIVAGTDGASILGGNSSDVYLTVIPEPNSAALFGFGGLVLLGIRRLASQKTKNSVKIAVPYLIIGITFLGFDLRAQSTVSTPVVGFQKIALPVGGKAIAPTFTKANVFQGLATISGSTVSVAANALTGLALGPTAFSNRANYPKFYVEVIQANSPFYGYNFDITAENTSSSFTSDNIPSGLSGAVTIAIRQHVTLADLNPSTLSDGDSVTLANDPSGSLENYYVFSGGWINADFDTSKDFGHVIIPPGVGLVYTGQGSEVLQVTLTGTVKTTPTAVPVYQNAYANFVAPINPSAAINYAGQNIANGIGDGGAFTVFSSDGAFIEQAVYYSSNGGLLDSNFSEVTSANVPGGEAVSVGALSSDGVWIVPPALNP
jgi:hypothetical protein